MLTLHDALLSPTLTRAGPLLTISFHTTLHHIASHTRMDQLVIYLVFSMVRHPWPWLCRFALVVGMLCKRGWHQKQDQKVSIFYIDFVTSSMPGGRRCRRYSFHTSSTSFTHYASTTTLQFPA
eukprot:6476302-Amphidinium_carterae.2